MDKKKLLAVAASLVLVIPAFSLTASANNGDIIKVGGLNEKIMTDFNSFPDGYKCNALGNKKDPLYSCYNGTKGLNMHVGKLGVDGSSGLVFSVTSDVDATNGINDGAMYKANNDTNPVYDFRGATDFIFWVDCTNETNPTIDINCNIGEWDYNEDGTNYMLPDDNDVMQQQETNRNIVPNKDHVYYTLQDGTTEWQTVNGITKGYVVEVPNTFKGYIRIPLEDFGIAWSTDDIDGKWDLMHVDQAGFYYGMYQRDVAKGYAIVIDNVGFVGDFANQPPITTNTASNTTATKANVTTAANTTSTGSNPSTGEAPITAAVVTAIVFAGVLTISKKRAKK